MQLFAAIHLDDITVMLYADVRSRCPQRKRSHRNSLHPHSARNLKADMSLCAAHVRFGGKADIIAICSMRASHSTLAGPIPDKPVGRGLEIPVREAATGRLIAR